MADGLILPFQGSGDTQPKIATDDGGASGHVQLFKLGISTDGSVLLIPADVANGLDVDVTRVQGTVTVAGTVAVSALAGALPTGSNAIGKLAANSGVDIGDVDVLTAPAAARTSDAVAAALQSDALMNGLTVMTPKFASITASASGDTAVVAGVGAKKIRVVSYVLTANGAVNAKFRSGTSDISGLEYLAANGGVAAPYNPHGHFETAVATALNINLSGAVAVGGHLTYVEV